MKKNYINDSNISVAMGVFLASDSYDYIEDREGSVDTSKMISVTTLLKPIRQIILTERMDFTDVGIKLSDMIANRMGQAIHDGIENAWVNNYQAGLEALGYPQKSIDKFIINPPEGTDLTDRIPVYTEVRSDREIKGYTITGKFDFAINGTIEDFKTTSVWTAVRSRADEKYVQQLSIYKWLNPDKISNPVGNIHWIFTDWSKQQSYGSASTGYPASRYQSKSFKLMSDQEVEAFITKKINDLETYRTIPQEQLPRCSPEELWQSEPVYKYYRDPTKTTRATKNFKTRIEAMQYYGSVGCVGVVIEVPGKVKACKYCPAFLICEQKDEYLASGELDLG